MDKYKVQREGKGRSTTVFGRIRECFLEELMFKLKPEEKRS